MFLRTLHLHWTNLRQKTAFRTKRSTPSDATRDGSPRNSAASAHCGFTWDRKLEGRSAKSMHLNINSSVVPAVHNDLRLPRPTRKSNLALSDHIWGFSKSCRRPTDVSRTRECHVPRTELGELPEAHCARAQRSVTRAPVTCLSPARFGQGLTKIHGAVCSGLGQTVANQCRGGSLRKNGWTFTKKQPK